MTLRALLIVVTCAACSQEEVMARMSGHILGCRPETVVVDDIGREGTRPRTWTATCDAAVWQCDNTSGRVTCQLGRRRCWDSWGKVSCTVDELPHESVRGP